uniref:Putative secreted protein n=1 Tax=Ixodes ricinus TaxID=34613 RepID=A0A6B0U3T4_IXORI
MVASLNQLTANVGNPLALLQFIFLPALSLPWSLLQSSYFVRTLKSFLGKQTYNAPAYSVICCVITFVCRLNCTST